MDGYTLRLGAFEPEPVDEPERLLRAARAAMGCMFEVFVLADDDETSLAVAEEALDEVERLDRQLSHYRVDSDIARLNANAGKEWVRVEPELFTLLRRCVAWSQATMGAFDVTCGAVLEAWDFHTGEGRLADDEHVAVAREQSGASLLMLDESANLVHFGAPGMLLNLGAVGKGYALDRAAEILRAFGVSNAVLHGGRSTIIALGTGPASQGWQFPVRDPDDRSRSLATITLSDAALSTSAVYNQHHEVDGMRYGHILNPTTGRPAEGPLCAMVVARTAAESDAISTALFVLGAEHGRSVMATMPHIRGIVLERAPGGATSVVEIGPP